MKRSTERQQGTALHRSTRLKRLLHPVLIPALLIAAVYSSSLGGVFLLDDKHGILDNPSIRQLRPIGPVLNPPRPSSTVAGRPVVNISLAVNYALNGQNATGYHIVNILIHVLAAITLYGLVRRTLELPGSSPTLSRASTSLATAVALIWSLHPLQTSAVTYLIQRAEMLVALFYLLTLYCVLRSCGSRFSAVWQLAAVAACALGMGSKEVMVSSPVITLLYDRLFLTGSFRETLARRGGMYLGLAGTWVLLAYLVISTAGRAESAGFDTGISAGHYALTQIHMIAGYLQRAVWPDPLIFDYGTRIITNPGKVLAGATVLLILIVGCGVACYHNARLCFPGLVFFAVLAPSSSLVPIATQTGAEHRMYLPLAAVVAAIVIGVYLLIVYLRARFASMPIVRRMLYILPRAITVLVTLVLSLLTINRNFDYHSAERIWQDTVDKLPDNPRAHTSLGIELMHDGRINEAIDHFTTAIRLDHSSLKSYGNRGNAYQMLGQYEKALIDYGRVIALNPVDPLAYPNRGNLHSRMGHHEAAIRDYSQAIEIDPYLAEAYNNRGSTYNELGDYDMAVRDFTQAISIKPEFSLAYGQRASAYYHTGRFHQAWEDIQAMRRLGREPTPEFLALLEKAMSK